MIDPADNSAPASSWPVTPVTSTKPHEIELDAFSIAEFCRRHSISRGHYYNLQQDGDGPKEKRARGRVLITKEAAAEWRTRQ